MVPTVKVLKCLPCMMLPTASLAVDIAEQSKIIKPDTIFFKMALYLVLPLKRELEPTQSLSSLGELFTLRFKVNAEQAKD